MYYPLRLHQATIVQRKNGRPAGTMSAIMLLFLVIAGTRADTIPEMKEQGYRIEQPGTITFTVGVKISGKVEKPQVMIFLPKEKTLYREETFNHSFIGEISEPLPFRPVVE
jgi:hypothetical protein